MQSLEGQLPKRPVWHNQQSCLAPELRRRRLDQQIIEVVSRFGKTVVGCRKHLTEARYPVGQVLLFDLQRIDFDSDGAGFGENEEVRLLISHDELKERGVDIGQQGAGLCEP